MWRSLLSFCSAFVTSTVASSLPLWELLVACLPLSWVLFTLFIKFSAGMLGLEPALWTWT